MMPFTDGELSAVVERMGFRARSGTWTARPIDAGVVNASSTGGVWRVASAEDKWSVVLKVLRHSSEGHRHWLSTSDSSDPMYWKREALFLTSGLVDASTSLRPPRCFGSFEGDHDTIRLWLEDAKGTPGAQWGVADYRLAARHLGQFQGRFVRSGEHAPPLPREPWLSRGWLRAYVKRREPDLSIGPPKQIWRDPLVRLAFPEDVSEPVEHLWAERNQTLDRLDACPQTVCHQDFWPKNLFLGVRPDGERETLAIDWAYIGLGAAGEDAANLAADSLRDLFLLPSEHAGALTEAVFDGYMQGLGDAGADVDRRRVRFAFCAAASLKYAWGFPDLLFLAMDKEAQARANERIAIGLERFYVERGVIQRLLLRLAAEARELGAELF